MKVAATTTLLFATLALANPAPVAQPDTAAAPLAAPLIETREQFRNALAARDAEAISKIQLEARKKKPKPSNNKNKTNTSSAASDLMGPSRALQLSAMGLGVMEVVRLWG